MIRNAFTMKLKPGMAETYRKRHDAIWPELKAELSKAGIRDYSIFLDERTGVLFAVQKLEADHQAEALPDNPVVRKWWAFMADLMETHPDDEPVSFPLREMFHMD